jgi:hypothetical protein
MTRWLRGLAAEHLQGVGAAFFDVAGGVAYLLGGCVAEEQVDSEGW